MALALLAVLATTPVGAPVPVVSPDAQLKQAEQSFFDADLDTALAQVTALEREEASAAEPPPERPRALLLHAAILLKKHDEAGAKAMALSALTIDPELSTDAYPPSVRQFVDAQRLALPKRTVVRISDVPAGADVRIDGRALPPDGVLTVVPGAHVLVVRKAGAATPDRRTLDVGASEVAIAIEPPPTPLAVRLWNDPRSGPALAGASALSLAGAGYSLWALQVTQSHRAQATTAKQRRYYEPYAAQFAAQSAAGIAAAVACGYLAVDRFHHAKRAPRTPVVSIAPLGVVGGGGGAALFVSGRY